MCPSEQLQLAGRIPQCLHLCDRLLERLEDLGDHVVRVRCGAGEAAEQHALEVRLYLLDILNRVIEIITLRTSD